MALADRHEYARALADFNRLIKRDPNVADDYLQRRLVHLHNGEPKLAVNDLDQALKIAPDLVKAHMVRGSIYLYQGRREEAR